MEADGRFLFLTGFLRSGTTLLEKRVLNDMDVGMLSQPLPLLFVEMKRSFIKQSTGKDVRYPLGHLFREATRMSDFLEYLESTKVPAAFVETVFDAMREYSGCQTKEVLSLEIPEGDRSFVEWYRFLIENLSAQVFRSESPRLVGSKEVFCEEYLPYLLENEVASCIILRDPRKVLASAMADFSGRYAGNELTLLQIVRQWRKSVAIALALEGRERFCRVRFEDLVADPAHSLQQIAAQTGASMKTVDGAVAAHDLRDQYGERWKANSSFTGTTIRRELDESMEALVLALCHDEMRYLGYLAEGSEAPVPTSVQEMMQVAGFGVRDIEMETERLVALRGEGKEFGSDADIEAMFVTVRAFEALCEGLVNNQACP